MLIILGLQSSFEELGLYEKMQENDLELDTLSNGIKVLLYAMIGWLGLITIASVVVFIIVNIRLNQANRALDELEVGSESTVTSKRSRVVDIFSRTDPPTFYSSDREPSSTHDADVIKVRATDDECECVNGSPTNSGPTPSSSSATVPDQ